MFETIFTQGSIFSIFLKHLNSWDRFQISKVSKVFFNLMTSCSPKYHKWVFYNDSVTSLSVSSFSISSKARLTFFLPDWSNTQIQHFSLYHGCYFSLFSVSHCIFLVGFTFNRKHFFVQDFSFPCGCSSRHHYMVAEHYVSFYCSNLLCVIDLRDFTYVQHHFLSNEWKRFSISESETLILKNYPHVFNYWEDLQILQTSSDQIIFVLYINNRHFEIVKWGKDQASPKRVAFYKENVIHRCFILVDSEFVISLSESFKITIYDTKSIISQHICVLEFVKHFKGYFDNMYPLTKRRFLATLRKDDDNHSIFLFNFEKNPITTQKLLTCKLIPHGTFWETENKFVMILKHSESLFFLSIPE
jgi:hypothetical protein